MTFLTAHPRFKKSLGLLVECALGVALLTLVYLQFAPNVNNEVLAAAPAAIAAPTVNCGTSFVCITDDHTGDVLSFDCPGGNYCFTHQANGLTLTGVGTTSFINNVESIADRKPDRKINGGLLLGQGTGSAVVYFFPVAGGGIQVFHLNQTIPFRACTTCEK